MVKTNENEPREMLDLVRRMAHLAEYRVAGIKNHLERMRGYCGVLGRGLDLSAQEAELVSVGSLLHDIGKVVIPEATLVKPGEYSPSEWETVKSHTTVGAEMLSGSTSVVLEMGAIIALTHHERWDGSGYPRNLRGDSIPLSGRICALADVFDALTTPRAYKREVPLPEALELIEEASGQLFDPEVVKVFKVHYEDIISIRQYNL